MSQQELQRLKVVENAVEGRLSVAEAAELLGVSTRQVKRLKGAYDPANSEWVQHGNRGRQPVNAMSEETRDRVLELARGKYAEFNDSHLHEKLTQYEGLFLSRASVQHILREANMRSPQKRRPSKYRSRRERRSAGRRASLDRSASTGHAHPPRAAGGGMGRLVGGAIPRDVAARSLDGRPRDGCRVAALCSRARGAAHAPRKDAGQQ